MRSEPPTASGERSKPVGIPGRGRSGASFPALSAVGGLVLAIVLVGCQAPPHLRLPSWFARHPQVEKQSYEVHDPLPDSQVGPDTLTRPRGFIQQRTEPRRAAEQRILGGMGSESLPFAPAYPPGSGIPSGSAVPSAGWGTYPDALRY